MTEEEKKGGELQPESKPQSEPQKKKRKSGGVHQSHDLKKAIVLLSYLRDKNQIEIENIGKLFESEGVKDNNPKKTQLIIDNLVDSHLPVERYGNMLSWIKPFDNYDVGRRLRQSCESKVLLAERVINLLISQEPAIQKIFIGAGSSLYYFTQKLIQRRDEVNMLKEIYTNNIPSLYQLIPFGNLFKIHVPDGRIIMEDGTIISDKGIENLKQERFNAAIVSFLGMNFKKGFSSDGKRDENEKMMNLRLNSSIIYIILGWEKFGVVGDIAATTEEGIDPEKKYIVVTNPPPNWQNNEPEKLEEYKKWSNLIEKEIVKFVFI